MNSEGKIGKSIKWLKPLAERNYDNLVENVDFIILKNIHVCPVPDGAVILFEEPGCEWLLIKENQIPDIDYEFYRLNQVSRPTNIKDSELTNYNIWKIEYQIIRLEVDEIIANIKQHENAANIAIECECDKTKTDMKLGGVLIALANKIPLTLEQEAVYQRNIERDNLVSMNADNARILIEQVKLGNTPDVTTGWHTDSITAQFHFYNETV